EWARNLAWRCCASLTWLAKQRSARLARQGFSPIRLTKRYVNTPYLLPVFSLWMTPEALE
ncbi:MAG: hypothetical protein WA071_07270, partial [Undibacterium umbellatum]|uniref:hypothetical protein n=1 Tax=Undibacterium umbellatum TaxID=2762300 RepID=UPI003BB4DFDE